MTKYNIEGGMNFYEELQKCMDEDNDDESDNEESKLCLITNTPLTSHYVTMKCGHTFNYEPLYRDISSVKMNYVLEYVKLKANEIQCPYCRSRELRVLPYIPSLRLPKKDGVNWLDVSKHIVRGSIRVVYGKCAGAEDCDKTEVIPAPDSDVCYCSSHYIVKYSKKSANRVKSVKTVQGENVVISSGKCQVLLKSGSRKGQPCGANAKQAGCCLRHVSV